ncbi:hypothetical protein BT69DRAFT_103943 [Atractiella rhizophila]|nr:hypothetical protein BT69DRAFT_103943 [Atractiella rhizophila]
MNDLPSLNRPVRRKSCPSLCSPLVSLRQRCGNASSDQSFACAIHHPFPPPTRWNHLEYSGKGTFLHSLTSCWERRRMDGKREQTRSWSAEEYAQGLKKGVEEERLRLGSQHMSEGFLWNGRTGEGDHVQAKSGTSSRLRHAVQLGTGITRAFLSAVLAAHRIFTSVVKRGYQTTQP